MFLVAFAEEKMITHVLTKIFGTANDRKIKQLQPVVDKINSFEPEISKLTDEQRSLLSFSKWKMDASTKK